MKYEKLSFSVDGEGFTNIIRGFVREGNIQKAINVWKTSCDDLTYLRDIIAGKRKLSGVSLDLAIVKDDSPSVFETAVQVINNGAKSQKIEKMKLLCDLMKVQDVESLLLSPYELPDQERDREVNSIFDGWVTESGLIIEVPVWGHDSMIYDLIENGVLPEQEDISTIEKKWVRMSEGNVYYLGKRMTARQKMAVETLLFSRRQGYFNKVGDVVRVGMYGTAVLEEKFVKIVR